MRAIVLAFIALTACGSSTAPPPLNVRIILFGDSNTEGGWDAQGNEVEWGYVSAERPWNPPTTPNGRYQLAGKIERLDQLIHAVNHGASGRTTGDARLVWQGVSMYEAEVLGMGNPWGGAEGNPRVLAFVPTQSDYVYVSLGTNDWSDPHFIRADSTGKNLEWMVNCWLSAGLPATHFILTTLPPRSGEYGREITSLNKKLRILAAKYHLSLIDLSAYTSSDDGATWRSPAFHIGDGTHYAESVRDWLARSVVEIIR